jgi:hypothetical protein
MTIDAAIAPMTSTVTNVDCFMLVTPLNGVLWNKGK